MKNKNRDQFIISTKGGHPNFLEKTKSRITKKDLKLDLELSLKTLNTDYIDIYWLHRDSENIPVDEIIIWLENFKREGKIREYGCSNWSCDRVEKGLNSQSKKGKGFIGNQILFNISSKHIEELRDKSMTFMTNEMMNLHNKTKLPVFAYSPFSGGSLFKKTREKNYTAKGIKYKITIDDLMSNFLSKEDVIIQSMSFFFKEQSFPVIPIFGVNNIFQLEELLTAYRSI